MVQPEARLWWKCDLCGGFRLKKIYRCCGLVLCGRCYDFHLCETKSKARELELKAINFIYKPEIVTHEELKSEV